MMVLQHRKHDHHMILGLSLVCLKRLAILIWGGVLFCKVLTCWNHTQVQNYLVLWKLELLFYILSYSVLGANVIALTMEWCLNYDFWWSFLLRCSAPTVVCRVECLEYIIWWALSIALSPASLVITTLWWWASK